VVVAVPVAVWVAGGLDPPAPLVAVVVSDPALPPVADAVDVAVAVIVDVSPPVSSCALSFAATSSRWPDPSSLGAFD